MATVTVYGSSDDLVEVEGPVRGCDEYNDDVVSLVLSGPAGAVSLGVMYMDSGLWAIGASPVEEDRPMLPVQIRSHPNGYSACAIVGGVDLVVREAAS